MSLTIEDLGSRKTYLTAVKASLKSQRTGRFLLVEYKFGSDPAAPILLVGPKIDDLAKHVKAQKARELDRGGYKASVFVGTTGKLTPAVLQKLTITDDLARVVTLPDESSGSAEKTPATTAPKKDAAPTVSKMPPADTQMPSVNMKLGDFVADVAARKATAAALDHPKLKTMLPKRADAIVAYLHKNELKEAAKLYQQLLQDINDGQQAPVAKAGLERVAPVVEARKDKDATAQLKLAQEDYDAGRILDALNSIQRIDKRLGHRPYEDDASNVTKGVAKKGAEVRQDAAQIAAQAGSLADAYDKAKRDFETKLGKVEADKQRFQAYVAGAEAARAFLKNVATKGLRSKLKEIGTTAPGPKRTAQVEEALLAVQAYITDLSARTAAAQLSVDFLAMLRYLHGQLKQMHH